MLDSISSQLVATHLGPAHAKIKVAGFDIPQPCTQPCTSQGLGVAHLDLPQCLSGLLLLGKVGEGQVYPGWRIVCFLVLAIDACLKKGAIRPAEGQFANLIFSM